MSRKSPRKVFGKHPGRVQEAVWETSGKDPGESLGGLRGASGKGPGEGPGRVRREGSVFDGKTWYFYCFIGVFMKNVVKRVLFSCFEKGVIFRLLY